MLPFPITGEGLYGDFEEKWFADFILDAYMTELGLSLVFYNIKRQSKTAYDLPGFATGFAKFIVYERIITPGSCTLTAWQNKHYYMPIVNNDEFDAHRVDNILESAGRIIAALIQRKVKVKSLAEDPGRKRGLYLSPERIQAALKTLEVAPCQKDISGSKSEPVKPAMTSG